jgi:hypothetical protein
VRAFARSVAQLLVEREPFALHARTIQGRARPARLVDTNRNGYAQSAVAAYSVPAQDGAPISVPTGMVTVWDTGTLQSDVNEALARQLERGEIKFLLRGWKLRGSFVLIHTARRATVKSRADHWLLIKHRDEFVDRSWGHPAARIEPLGAASG